MSDIAVGGKAAMRSVPARIGICLLNLLTPGLGLFRTMQPAAGTAFALTPIFSLLILYSVFQTFDQIAPSGFLLIGMGLLLLVAACWIGSIALTWQSSRSKPDYRPWWSRWYSLTAIWLAFLPLPEIVVSALHRFYKPYYAASEAMFPTVSVGDRIVADMRKRTPVKRGDVVIIRVGDTDYVKRVAALGGDTIEMRRGVVVLNGTAVPQREGDHPGVREEQFPEEIASHRVFDLGYSSGDDFPAVRVPTDAVFVLGDNRDRSADSRFEREGGGVGMARVSEVRGKVDFVSWRPRDGWVGEPVR